MKALSIDRAYWHRHVPEFPFATHPFLFAGARLRPSEMRSLLADRTAFRHSVATPGVLARP